MKITSDLICSRCGGPAKISKTWVEMLETRAGPSKLTYSQIVCLDKKCLAEFNKKLAEDRRKKDELKLRAEEYAKNKKDEAAKRVNLK